MNFMDILGKTFNIWRQVKHIYRRLERVEAALDATGAIDFTLDSDETINNIRELVSLDAEIDPDNKTGDERVQRSVLDPAPVDIQPDDIAGHDAMEANENTEPLDPNRQ